MTRKVDIVSQAFITIGEQPVTDLETGGNYVASASKIYDIQYSRALTAYNWSFAKTVAQLSRLTDVPAEVTGWAYAYQLPADCLLARRVYPLCEYEIMSGKIFTNQTELWLQYTYKPVEAKLPAYFIDYLVNELCANFCVLVTAKASLQKMYMELSPTKLSQAAFKDSITAPQQQIASRPFIEVRM